MKKNLVSITILTLLAINLSAAALFKADFNGSWTLDKSRSEGLPPGMEQTMNVVQTGDTIKIETTVKTEKGEQKVADAYTLNGKEADFASPTLGGAKGKRTGKWNDVGNGFVVNEKAEVETPDGQATIEFTRKWTLSADGKTLIIEINAKDPQGEKLIKRTFTKSK